MQHAAGLAHAAGADDHAGRVVGIDGLRALRVADVFEPVELERRVALSEMASRFGVVALGMHAEHVGQAHGQRRVDVHPHGRHASCCFQALQGEDQLLCALQRERRHDHLAPAPVGTTQYLRQRIVHALDRIVNAIPVGALGDQQMGAGRHFRIAQDGDVAAPQVAGEHQAAVVFLDVQRHDRAAQDVPRIVKRQTNAGGDVQEAVIGQGDHRLHRPLYVLLVVQGLDRIHGHAVALDAAVDVVGVGGLDHRRIFQHRHAQIAGGRRAVDRAPVALLHQQRQRTGVVDVSMAQDNGVEVTGSHRQVLVLFEAFPSPPLEQPTVEQDLTLAGPEPMHRPRHGSRRAQEVDVHAQLAGPVARPPPISLLPP